MKKGAWGRYVAVFTEDPGVERRVKVGRAEEGCSSSRPEGGALFLTLRSTRAEDDLLSQAAGVSLEGPARRVRVPHGGWMRRQER